MTQPWVPGGPDVGSTHRVVLRAVAELNQGQIW